MGLKYDRWIKEFQARQGQLVTIEYAEKMAKSKNKYVRDWWQKDLKVRKERLRKPDVEIGWIGDLETGNFIYRVKANVLSNERLN